MKVIIVPLVVILFMISTISCSYTSQDNLLWSFEEQNSLNINNNGSDNPTTGNFSSYKNLKKIEINRNQNINVSGINPDSYELTLSFWFQYNPIPNIGNNYQVLVQDVRSNVWLYYYKQYGMFYVSSPNSNEQIQNQFIEINNGKANHFVLVYNGQSFQAYLNGNQVASSDYNRNYEEFEFNFNYSYGNSSDLVIIDAAIYNQALQPETIEKEFSIVRNSPQDLNTVYYLLKVHGLTSGNIYQEAGQNNVLSDNLNTGEVTDITYNRFSVSSEQISVITKSVEISDQYGATFTFWFKPNSQLRGQGQINIFSGSNTTSGDFSLNISKTGKLCFQPNSNTYSSEGFCSHGYGYLQAGDFWSSIVIVCGTDYTEILVNGNKVEFSENEQTEQSLIRIDSIDLNQSYKFIFNGDGLLSGDFEDFQVFKNTWNEATAYEYHHLYYQNLRQCAAIFTECEYTGNSQQICGHESNISLPFMRSILLPPGKKITLFTGVEFTGDYQVFTESVECQELVYLPQDNEEDN